MGGSNLNLKLDSTTRGYVPKTIDQFLGDLSLIGDVSERLSKLDDFRNRLEEESTKIDPFKRDLPLSVLLINDAIKTLKDEEEIQYRRRRRKRNHQPVLEEFIPLKKTSEEDETIQLIIKDNSKDKKNWLSSAQLWKTDDDDDDDDSKNVDLVRRNASSQQLVIKEEGGVKEELNDGSFKACSMVGKTGKEEKVEEESTISALSLVSPGMKKMKKNKNFKEDESSFKINGGVGKAGGSSSTSSLQLQPNSRKQRRCWSPELHRQFVNALQQLGGSHVATPKQIREVMRVDGLTNDEVKSHLQKYRLHTRKACLRDENRPMILFMDQDQYSESSKQSSSQSASPHGPFDLAAAAAAAANGGGTSLEEEDEDEDDDKSESCVWKNEAYKSGKVRLIERSPCR